MTSATPASAITSAAAAAFFLVMSPRQKPWLIVTSPPRSSARVRAQISWTFEEAHLARLVQVDVEPDTMPRGDGEDGVELPPCSSQGQAVGGESSRPILLQNA